MVKIPTLETERLRLRPLRESDFEEYAALYADPEVLRYLGSGPEPWDRGRAWRHMAFIRGHWEIAGAGMWVAEHKETGAFLGLIGFAAPEGWPGFELAWTLARRWWGHGYATEGPGRLWPTPSPSSRRTASSASSIRRIGPPSAWPSASARARRAASFTLGGRCCASGSTG